MTWALVAGYALCFSIALLATFYGYRAAIARSSDARWAWLCAMAWAMGALANTALQAGRLS